MTHFETIVRGGNVVTPDGLASADVAIVNGTIVAVGPELEGGAKQTIDAHGLVVLPGAIDVHVHFNAPGRDAWEGWPTGSLAAATGGTTTVVDMPLNANPPTLDGLSFDAKLRAAESSSFVDFAFWGGLTPNNLGSMEELAERGVVGFKAFMCDSGIEDFPAADDGTLFEGMRRAAALGLPIAVHAENEALTRSLAARARAGGMNDAHAYAASRPPIAEIEAISRALLFAETMGCALHVVHVSTASGAALVASARARGIDVTAETCPHYLWFAEEDLDELGALAKCAPPLRGRSEVLGLRKAVARGDLQIVASDHSPCPEPMKHDADFFQIWGGIAGCQTLLMAMLSASDDGGELPLSRIAELLGDAPARRLRLPTKGRIAPGFDADLALVDFAAAYTLEPSRLRYRHSVSAFANRTFRATVRRTMLRGQTVVLDSEPVASPRGTLLRPVLRNAL
jgi:allantoinase